ncbi:MAG: transposase [Anaerobutyricum soehngenii]
MNSIYGISTTASCAIIAEIGIDMKPFKTAEHICSWAGLAQVTTKVGKRKAPLSQKATYIKYALRNCLGDCRETQHLSSAWY